MATRPVFVAVPKSMALVDTISVDFEWFSGFAPSQKQRSIESLHGKFKADFPELNVLEISTKSDKLGGVRLSAFNLVAQEGVVNISVESAFQASKVFEFGGPYSDLLWVSAKEAKQDSRLRSSGKLIGFQYKGAKWPLEPKTLFYDWLYMKSLHQYAPLNKYIVNFDAFTDIEFNPDKSINCQARSAALYVSLYRAGILGVAMNSIEDYKRVLGVV